MKRRIMQKGWVVLALSLVLGAYDPTCGAAPATAVPAAADMPAEWVKTEIYFGRDLPGGQEISRWAWADFMDKVLTQHFPKGLTVYEAYGQMQHADGRIEKQSTWVVAVVHPKDPAIDKTIQEIINVFRKQFNKAQVVHVSTPVISARFYAD
ncbi:MAG: DUF3574 domain-containing protein [Verrucomicrobia bacterium]|nr:DUF3574 domain-containing protein [Verrucomicrobiota bacterium]MBU1736175.1 DUF3574 domain-containing protein [Verrucomicrobiota bacterium]MBU1856775.1 DUF3574 domain-containing protein [Verrucomicrobiota bacterium]